MAVNKMFDTYIITNTSKSLDVNTYYDYSKKARYLEMRREFLVASELWHIASVIAKNAINSNWAMSRSLLCKHLNSIVSETSESHRKLPKCYLYY